MAQALDSPFEPLTVDAIEASVLQALLPGFVIRDFESCDSTNTQSLNDQNHRSLHLAKSQNKGRGRRGRHWVSQPGQGLYLTLGLEFQQNSQLSLLPIKAGIGLCSYLIECGYPACLKWPNDILINHAKVAGILVESRLLLDNRIFVATGIGINLLAPERTGLSQPASGLSEHGALQVNVNEFIAGLITRLMDTLMIEDFEQVVKSFAALDLYHRLPVMITTDEQTWHGINQGIDQSGRLCLETIEGICRFAAGDVSMRPDHVTA